MNGAGPKRVLIVEDDKSIAALLREQLEFESYDTEWVESGSEALTRVESGSFDLVLLDLGLPDQSGFDVCRTIRERSKEPLLVLTARHETADKVRALDLGADDYLTKPFEVVELLARVRALLRRSRAENGSPGVLRLGEIAIDGKKRRVTRAGEEVLLTAREFELLFLLASKRGEVVSRDAMLEELWPGIYVTPRTVDVHIAALRKKLEDDPASPALIVSVRGVGYKLGIDTS